MINTSDGQNRQLGRPIGIDPAPSIRQYAHPEKIVSNDWLGAHLGRKGVKVVESNEDNLLYSIGHIPTAVSIDWAQDLGDPVERDFIDGRAFAALMNEKGIARDDTVIIYGDRSNVWAAYTLWIFELFGHPDVRLLDGGRDAWIQEEKETAYADFTPIPPAKQGYPIVNRNDQVDRVFVSELKGLVEGGGERGEGGGVQIIDLRDQAQYAGYATLEEMIDALTEFRGKPGQAEILSSRHGHIPSARRLAKKSLLLPNGRFSDRNTLERLHSSLDPSVPTIVYCNNGSRAALEWYVLRFLMGWSNVRLYDGSWGEWGNMVKMPIAQGDGVELS